ncbi:MAG: hypothetical protein V4662_25065 [Verrucomicrobiota bacterium]
MKSFVFPVIQRALQGADELPPAERADLYQGISECLAAKFPTEAQAALNTAEHLRDTEAQQRHFNDLLIITPTPLPHEPS